MGFAWSRPPDSPVGEQQLTLEMQTLELERQIHLRGLLQRRKLALKIAEARELFFWLTAFYALSAAGLGLGFQRTRRLSTLAPLLPLTFVLAYQGDSAYGSKQDRIRGEAENILVYEPELLEAPLGLPTVGGIDESREKARDEESFSKAHDIFL
ncbi:hypothetical protein HPB47_002537 [Ixodes persulcatus]|uniref:Uncharacterized protein n=1 Tax=Ixodes persulcatus TaxID=34615 RepID=A0AC60PMM6_IXOPE|nr:hypothetical protein HPB47_002537 [Ixodes persulcatus]